MKTTICAAALLWSCAAGTAAAEEPYPNKPIRWVIPYAPGGGTDVIARPIALQLGEAIGQVIVYDNRGGAAGFLAAETVAKADPDGYTWLVAAGNTHVFATLLFRKVPFDPVKDFIPVTNFALIPNVLVSRPAFPVKTIADIVAYGKAHPGGINWASSGNGAGGHLALVLFARDTGIQVVHVPFKGAGPATNAMLAGQTDLLFANTGVFLSHIRSGKLRALGVAHAQRLDVLPDVPTFDEAGYKGFTSGSFYGLAAPAGTPQPIVNFMHEAVVKVIRSPESLRRLAANGAFPVGDTPEHFAEYLREEVAKWGRIVRENGIHAD